MFGRNCLNYLNDGKAPFCLEDKLALATGP